MGRKKKSHLEGAGLAVAIGLTRGWLNLVQGPQVPRPTPPSSRVLSLAVPCPLSHHRHVNPPPPPAPLRPEPI